MQTAYREHLTLSEPQPLRRITSHDLERILIVNYWHFGTFYITHETTRDGTHIVTLEDFWCNDLVPALHFTEPTPEKLQRVRERINSWLRYGEEVKRHAGD